MLTLELEILGISTTLAAVQFDERHAAEPGQPYRVPFAVVDCDVQADRSIAFPFALVVESTDQSALVKFDDDVFAAVGAEGSEQFAELLSGAESELDVGFELVGYE